MGCMQMGHLITGPAQPRQRTRCMQGNMIIVLLLVRQIQQASILFLSSFTLSKVAMQSASIFSNFSLLNFSYLKARLIAGLSVIMSSLAILMKDRERVVSCSTTLEARIFSVSMKLTISRSLSKRSNCYLSS